VSQKLCNLCPEVMFLHETSLERLPSARNISIEGLVLATQSFNTDTCDQIEDWANDLGAWFVPAGIEDDFLQVGPMIVYGNTACWRCGYRRQQQHDTREDTPPIPVGLATSEALPKWIYKPAANSAASRIATLLAATRCVAGSDNKRSAGTVWRMNLITTEVQESTVVGIHGCSRCGLRRNPETLSTEAILAECRELWSPRYAVDDETYT
jgi:bacteriocin biosynthesis cyclodehydratase domain-containing protein